MRQLCLPIMHKYGVVETETEADNFICLFSHPMDALMAASEMKEVLALYERSLSADMKHFAPTCDFPTPPTLPPPAGCCGVAHRPRLPLLRLPSWRSVI